MDQKVHGWLDCWPDSCINASSDIACGAAWIMNDDATYLWESNHHYESYSEFD